MLKFIRQISIVALIGAASVAIATGCEVPDTDDAGSDAGEGEGEGEADAG